MFYWYTYPLTNYKNMAYFSQVYPEITKEDWRSQYKLIHLEKTSTRCKKCDRNLNKFLIDLDDMIVEFGYRYHVMIEIDCPLCSDYYSKI